MAGGSMFPVRLGVQVGGIEAVRGGTRWLLGNPTGVSMGVRHPGRRRARAGEAFRLGAERGFTVAGKRWKSEWSTGILRAYSY